MIPIAGHDPPADEEMLHDIVTMGKQAQAWSAEAKRARSPTAMSILPATSSARTT